MPWDDAKPRGNIFVSQLDDDTRAQLQFIQAVFQQIVTFPGTGGDPPTGDGGVMLNGSAKLHIGLAAVADATISAASDRNTGKLRYITDTDVFKICTVGSTDTWVQLPGSLGQALTMTALLTLNAGLTIPDDGGGARSPLLTIGDDGLATPVDFAGIVGPNDADWISDGAMNMNPLVHALARHNWIFAGGNWAAPLDDMRPAAVPNPAAGTERRLGMMPYLVHDGGAAPTAVNPIAQCDLDFTNRSGPSMALVLASYSTNTAYTAHGLTVSVGGVPEAQLTRNEEYIGSKNAGSINLSTAGIIVGLPAAVNNITMEATLLGGVPATSAVNRQLVVIDLGLDA